MLELDHLAVSAADLAVGTARIEDLFGVRLAPGGKHPDMGTHNRLLSLGPGLYLEVIAIDAAAPPPDRPRWFDLDNFDGPPRLTTWIVRCDRLEAALADAPEGTGLPMQLQRGDFRWRMAVPELGQLPLGGLAPALIEWQGDAHPADRLPDAGVRLTRLVVSHPRIREVPHLDDPRVVLSEGPPSLRTAFSTPKGEVLL